MIFVIAGTEHFPFDRLFLEIDSLKLKGVLDDHVYMQLGSSKMQPRNCFWTYYLSFTETVNKIETADLVIGHAGAGATLLCLNLGQRPILVPRRKEFGEHVDDHQLQLAMQMEALDLADVAYELPDIQRLIKYRKSTDNVRHKRAPNLALPHYLDQLVETWST